MKMAKNYGGVDETGIVNRFRSYVPCERAGSIPVSATNAN